MRIDLQVWRCPVHGLIESPRWFALYGPEEAEMICPINLSTDGTLTDDLCQETCEGPLVVTLSAADSAASWAIQRRTCSSNIGHAGSK